MIRVLHTLCPALPISQQPPEPDRQTDTYTHRQTHRQTDRHTDRRTGRQADRHRQTYRQTHRQTQIQSHRHTDRQTCRNGSSPRGHRNRGIGSLHAFSASLAYSPVSALPSWTLPTFYLSLNYEKMRHHDLTFKKMRTQLYDPWWMMCVIEVTVVKGHDWSDVEVWEIEDTIVKIHYWNEVWEKEVSL